jgi:hypothetical protein
MQVADRAASLTAKLQVNEPRGFGYGQRIAMDVHQLTSLQDVPYSQSVNLAPRRTSRLYGQPFSGYHVFRIPYYTRKI